MKELIKEETLDVIRQMVTDGQISQEVAEKYFPKLKESEDEKIRKALIFHYQGDGCICTNEYRIDFKDIRAWLEKQCQQKTDDKVESKFKVGDIITPKDGGHEPWQIMQVDILDKKYRFKDGYVIHFSQEDNYELVKQKTDKVEPKFEVGDWVVIDGEVLHIKEVTEDGYLTDEGGLIPFRNEKEAHIWTIDDAKNGNVLVASDDSIFLFAGVVDLTCKYYVALTTNGTVKFNEGLEHFWETSTAVHPATKKQCALLFSKMKEAGYEWDADKKKLKKIENEIEIPFSAKDSELQEATYYIPKGFHAEIEGNNVVIKKGKQKSAWSEKDEKYLKLAIDNFQTLGNSFLTAWLNSLKDRVQPKQEWSKEDENRINRLIDYFEDKESFTAEDDIVYSNWLKSLKDKVQPQSKQEWSGEDEEIVEALNDYVKNLDILFSEIKIGGKDIISKEFREKVQHWLKSIRPQSRWKPSEDQIKALMWVLQTIPYIKHKEEISGLLDQIKKL